jgi:predicted DNA-binding transcriptional regulator AlpA
VKLAPEHLDESVAALSREQVAQALGISLDTLDKLHGRGKGPPRFRVSPRRWAYPIRELREWQRQALSASTNAA